MTKINKKMYLIQIITMFVPFIYRTLRIFWISSNSGLLINASSWIYILLFTEVILYTTVFPIYKYISNSNSEQERVNKSMFSITWSILIALMYVLVFIYPIKLFAISIANVPGNELFTINEIWLYLFISLMGEFFRIVGLMIIAILILNNESWSILWISALDLTILVGLDLMLISDFAIIDNQSLNSIALSTLLSPVIILLFFISFFYFKEKEYIKNAIRNRSWFTKKEIKIYTKLSYLIGIEAFVRNLFYAVTTLQINNSISVDAVNTWNASMYLWFSLFPILTMPINQTSINDFTNKEKNQDEMLSAFTKLSLYTYGFILLIIYPCIEYLMPWTFNNGSYIEDAKNISWMILPFFFMMSYSGLLNNRFLARGDYKSYLLASLFANVTIMIPATIVFYSNAFESSLMFSTWLFNISIFATFIATMYLTYWKRFFNYERRWKWKKV